MRVVDDEQQRRPLRGIRGQPVKPVQERKLALPARAGCPLARREQRLGERRGTGHQGVALFLGNGQEGLEQAEHDAEAEVALELGAASAQDRHPSSPPAISQASSARRDFPSPPPPSRTRQRPEPSRAAARVEEIASRASVRSRMVGAVRVVGTVWPSAEASRFIRAAKDQGRNPDDREGSLAETGGRADSRPSQRHRTAARRPTRPARMPIGARPASATDARAGRGERAAESGGRVKASRPSSPDRREARGGRRARRGGRRRMTTSSCNCRARLAAGRRRAGRAALRPPRRRRRSPPR